MSDVEQDLEFEFSEGEGSVNRHGRGLSWWVVLALLMGAGAVLYIIMDGADEAVYAYTVDQAVAQQGELEGKRFRVRGLVKEGTIERKPGTLDTRFKLIHNGELITIAYNKPLPDTFQAGIEVLAQGKLQPGGVLLAEEVIAKCPSKYEEQAPTMGAGGAGHPEGIPRNGIDVMNRPAGEPGKVPTKSY